MRRLASSADPGKHKRMIVAEVEWCGAEFELGNGGVGCSYLVLTDRYEVRRKICQAEDIDVPDDGATHALDDLWSIEASVALHAC